VDFFFLQDTICRSHRRRQTVDAVSSMVTCCLTICPVLHDLQNNKINTASGGADDPPPMLKSENIDCDFYIETMCLR
jgi:hypothetical protein